MERKSIRIFAHKCKDEIEVENFYNYYFERQSHFRVRKWDTIVLLSSYILAQIEVETID